jgi:hypothetical protein
MEKVEFVSLDVVDSLSDDCGNPLLRERSLCGALGGAEHQADGEHDGACEGHLGD